MPTLLILVAAMTALVVSLVVMPVVMRWAARNDYVDRPEDDRRVHETATPNVGGVGIAIGIVAGMTVLALGFFDPAWFNPMLLTALAGGGVMLLAGLYDDIHGLGFKRKFLVQIVIAYALLHAGFRFDVAGLPFVGESGYDQALYSIPLTMLWIVGVINAINLIDGIDGLAGGIGAIAGGFMGALFLMTGQLHLAGLAFAVCAASLGFLYYNFYPASIFMGDTGSLTLGYALAVLPMAGTFHSEPFLAIAIPAVVLGVPILDTTVTIVRRMLRRKAICGPDDQHIHHRLMRRSNPRSASLTLYGVAGWFGAAAILLQLSTAFWAYVILVGSISITLGWVYTLGYFRLEPFLRARRLNRLRRKRLAAERDSEASQGQSHPVSGDGASVETAKVESLLGNG